MFKRKSEISNKSVESDVPNKEKVENISEVPNFKNSELNEKKNNYTDVEKIDRFGQLNKKYDKMNSEAKALVDAKLEDSKELIKKENAINNKELTEGVFGSKDNVLNKNDLAILFAEYNAKPELKNTPGRTLASDKLATYKLFHQDLKRVDGKYSADEIQFGKTKMKEFEGKKFKGEDLSEVKQYYNNEYDKLIKQFDLGDIPTRNNTRKI